MAIGCGLVSSDQHWASDVIAGALIGHAIGYSIGKAFRQRARGETRRTADFDLVPLIEPGFAGVAVRAPW